MAINFPNSPTDGQTYSAPNGVIYTYESPPGRWTDSGAEDTGGTVTTVSVVTANGLAGTVATPTTTPALTLGTTVTGMLKGDGTEISAAEEGTDYAAGVHTHSYLPLSGGDLSGGITGTTADFSGAVETGALTATTGNFSGNLTTDGIAYSATVSTTTVFADAVAAAVVTATGGVNAGTPGVVGRATLNTGDASNVGYIAFHRANNTRVGYIGFGDGKISHNAETGLYHEFTTGDVQIVNAVAYPNDSTSVATTAFVADAIAAGAGGITDAPSDTNVYGRKDAAWIEIVDISSGTYQNYLFNTTTSAPPASGSVRFNNATQTAVTTIWFSFTTNDVNAVNLETYWVQRVRAGDHFYFQDKDDPTKWQLYRLDSAYTDSGTYATMAVTWIAGGSALTGARIVVTREGGTDTSSLQPLDADLTALAALSTTGMMARSAANTYTMRTLTGTASRLSVTNGDGVSGNPTLNIDTAYVGQNTITTLGTVTTGVWNGTVVTGQYGGTGVANTGSTITLGGNLVTSGAFALTLTQTGTTNVTLPTTGTLATVADVATIAQNAQTGNYTMVAADAGKHIYHAVSSGAGDTYTIPANASVAYPIGTTLSFVNDDATNAVTIAITTDTMVLSPGTTTGSRTLATGGVATAIKVTSTRWIISGTGLT